MLNCLGGTARQGGAAKNNLDVSQVWISPPGQCPAGFSNKTPQPMRLPIDTCDRCGSQSGPLQIIIYKVGFEAVCLACKKKQYHEESKNKRNVSPTAGHRPAGPGTGENNPTNR